MEIKLEKLSGESKKGKVGKINIKIGDEIKAGDRSRYNYYRSRSRWICCSNLCRKTGEKSSSNRKRTCRRNLLKSWMHTYKSTGPFIGNLSKYEGI